MPRKSTRAYAQIDETQNKFHYEEAKFYKKRTSTDEEQVREFYANLTSSELTEVPVHGIKVPITSNAINEFFEFPDFENDEDSSLMSNIKPENLQEILEELTVPSSTWNASNEDPEEEEEDPTEIELMQSAEVLDKVEPLEPEVKPDDETSMLRAQPPSPDLQDELSSLWT
ncbi:hypothetical protein PVK06_011470 [Gossypium arboreum]|uniref:Uncharacterized protein n=1 Tax=Gossypium arboreum TaxID=29729 RepID=A0ABR0Q8V6_GOSAR|nr:hypothetical protein PVK06_011470 [Gossypium arboreum]